VIHTRNRCVMNVNARTVKKKKRVIREEDRGCMTR
jgi:hypothetical protein